MDMNLFETVLDFSEIAASIVRHMVRNRNFFNNICAVESLSFEIGFKRLTDILIQQTLKYYISKKFSGLSEHVKGAGAQRRALFEINSEETVEIIISESKEQTTQILKKVLGDTVAAQELAKILYPVFHNVELLDEVKNLPEIIGDDVGIWVDPSDLVDCVPWSASFKDEQSFLKSKKPSFLNLEELSEKTLKNITVLIGVYNRTSGVPVAGIINQPFFKLNRDDVREWYSSDVVWGIKYFGVSKNNTSPFQSFGDSSPTIHIVIDSKNENLDVICALKATFKVFEAPGVGYKFLLVITGKANLYLCSKDSTYFWDTCGPHAILKSQGGGIISYKSLFELGEVDTWSTEEVNKRELLYNNEDSSKHANGIVAYRNISSLQRVYTSLSKVGIKF